MTELTRQTPSLPYPRGVGRWLLRLPLALYRLGLGDTLNSLHVMILGTVGRVSGLPRYTPIEYRQHGSKLYLISAWGDQPHWYRNLLATPDVLAQKGSSAYSACAQVVTNPGEALRVLRLFRNRAPFVYDPLIARLSDSDQVDERTLPDIAQTITIVRLDPQPGAPPIPPIRADRGWMLWSGALAVIALLVIVVTRSASHRQANSS